MKKTTILALASAASALATAAASVADELVETPDNPQQESPDNAASGEPPKRRGRPPGSTNAPPAQTETPAPAATGKTYEQMRELITPLVKEGRGEEVKKIITGYGASSLKELPADKYPAFEKDIEALSY